MTPLTLSERWKLLAVLLEDLCAIETGYLISFSDREGELELLVAWETT